jgi:hypothetical protein
MHEMFFLQPMQGEDDDEVANGALRSRIIWAELKNTGRSFCFMAFFPIPFDFFEADRYIMQTFISMHRKNTLSLHILPKEQT